MCRGQPMSRATWNRGSSLLQAICKGDSEYLLLHQFMALFSLQDLEIDDEVVSKAMSHLAEVTEAAFGEAITSLITATFSLSSRSRW